LREIAQPILNWHTGILPRYRNVHTDFWAYVNNEPEGLGVTVFEIDEGIDTGRIVWSKKSFFESKDYLWMIKRRNLEIVADSMISLGINPTIYFSRPLVESNGKSLMCQTPTARDLFKLGIIELAKWKSNQ
jgi:hypothetical protein